MTRESWQALCADKTQRQKDEIPKDWLVIDSQLPPANQLNVLDFPRDSGLLTATELRITDSHIETLLLKLASGEWSSFDVTRAFYKRAILAHQVVNCLTEIFVERALIRAKEVDAYLKRTGSVIGPLHGLPISLKDQLSMKGLETTIGYASWIGKYADRDASLVEILHELGAVPFVRTNVPQTLMWAETYNLVFGRTTNPANRNLTSGGSSGGEGALIGMHGSPLGVGSDIGGSVRIPAALNGLYGLRPSYHRIPYRGAVNSLEGQESIPSVFGPISSSLLGVKLFMKSVIDAKPWLKDPLVMRKPWDKQGYELSEHGNGNGLVFGIIWDDGHEKPHPPILRALEMIQKALTAAGHKVIDWKPHKHFDLCVVGRSIFRAGSREDLLAVVASTNEPILESMSPESDDSKAVPFLPVSSIESYELWQLQKKKQQLRAEYLDHWEATVTATGTNRPVDALISPVAPYAAPPHGNYISGNYTTVWNVLDCPGLVFPVTTVDPVLDLAKPPHEFLSNNDKLIYELYSPEKFKDAPVGLQLLARPQEDEAVLGMGEIIDKALASFKKLDGSWIAPPRLLLLIAEGWMIDSLDRLGPGVAQVMDLNQIAEASKQNMRSGEVTQDWLHDPFPKSLDYWAEAYGDIMAGAKKDDGTALVRSTLEPRKT